MVCEFGRQIEEYLRSQVTRGPQADARIVDVASLLDFYSTSPRTKAFSLEPMRDALPSTCGSEAARCARYREDTRTQLRQLFAQHALTAVLVPSHPRASAHTPANAAGYPILNIPVGFAQDGSSVGMLLYGLAGSDSLLLQLGQAIVPPSRVRPSFLA